jgi:hypothetical protein
MNIAITSIIIIWYFLLREYSIDANIDVECMNLLMMNVLRGTRYRAPQPLEREYQSTSNYYCIVEWYSSSSLNQ